MTHKKVVDRIEAITGIPENDIRLVLRSLKGIVIECGKKRERMWLDDLGVFEFRRYKAKRVAANLSMDKKARIKEAYSHAFFKVAADVQREIMDNLYEKDKK